MTEMMRALIFDGPDRLRLGDFPRPVPAAGDVLVKVRHASICGTDIRIVAGRKSRDIRHGYPIGHECSGTVAEVGPAVTGYAPGEPVAVCVVVSCGECDACAADHENLCPRRVTLGYHTAGAFAEYMLIPAHAVNRGNVFKLPPEVLPEIAPLLEPMGCCLNGQHEMRAGRANTSGPSGNRTLLILGAGPIGLLHLSLARAGGGYDRIVMTEPLAHRREHALRLGADEVLAPDALEPREQFDDVIVAFGDPGLVDVAMRAARKCGRINLFAGFDKDTRLSFDPNLVHYNQLYLSGGSESRRRDYAEALELVRRGRVRPGDLVTHRFALEDYEEAFRIARERVGLKVVFLLP